MIALGTRLGPYEVLAPLGSGGMGEVYRARDTRLHREVAVKVLPEDFSADPERLRRFEGEARAASALNHPNILTIHDFGMQDGAPYVVSELLEGETLRERLAGGALPAKKAMDYARHVAEGLAAAHEKGIVHRDLKPENLFVTKDGRVKILDFGLAKLTRPERSSEGQTGAPTLTAGTEPGVVLGTVGYMSPEQVRGEKADHRSDIFSLGTILHEMLTGTRAFQGATAVETMNAILKEDPRDLALLQKDFSAGLDRLVSHCLEKSREERFQSARDLAFDLEALSGVSRPTPALAAAPRRTWHFSPAVAISAMLGAAALAFLAGSWASVLPGRRAGRVPPSFHQLTFSRGYVSTARLAPDGQTIVYGAAWEGNPVRLFTVRAGSAQSSPLSLPDADVLSVSRSEELALSLGRHFVFGFATAGTLARVPLGGGAPREILEGVQDAEWSPDGSALAVVRRIQERHRLEYPAGKVLYTTGGWVSHPRISPDGSRIAFFDHPVLGDDGGSVAVLDLKGVKTMLSRGWATEQGLAWAPSGKEVWFTAGPNSRELHAVTLSGRQRVVLRAPGSLHLYDIARDGRVLLAHEATRGGILGVGPGQTRERNLSWQDWSYGVDLSADGKAVLIADQGGGAGPAYAVYLRGTDGSPAVRLGEGQAFALSPDKKWALTLLLKEPQELVLLPTGAGEPRHVKRGLIQTYGLFGSWFPDGRRIQFNGREPGRGSRLYAQAIDGDPQPISPEGIEPAAFGHALSPDGRVVFARDSEGRGWLYPVEGGNSKPLPSLSRDENPVGWSTDGRALFVMRSTPVPSVVYRLDISSQEKTVWKDLTPADPAGLQYAGAHLVLDGAAYVYSYTRFLSDLYLVEGLE